MRIFKSLLVAALVAAIAIPSAYARSKKVKVPAGKNTAIGSFAVYDAEACIFMSPGTYKVVRQPKNGKVTVKRFSEKRKSTPCKGSTVSGWVFYYRGNGKPDNVHINVYTTGNTEDMGTRVWGNKFKIN